MFVDIKILPLIIAIFFALYGESQGYAWPVKKGEKSQIMQFLYDKPKEASMLIYLPSYDQIEVRKSQHKTTNKAFLEYGVNDVSSIFINLCDNTATYNISDIGRKKRFFVGNVRLLKRQIDFEIGSIMKLFQNEDAILSTYFAIHPYSYRITAGAKEDVINESTISLGIAYGKSFTSAYFEFFLLGQAHSQIKHEDLLMGVSFAVKPKKNWTIGINTTLYSGFYDYNNAAISSYIESFYNENQEMKRLVKSIWNSYFLYNEIKPFAKVHLKIEHKINKNTNVFWEVGTNLTSKVFADKTLALGIQRKL